MSGRTAVILRGLRGLLGVALAVVAVPAVAQAATVTNTGDSGAGSLRAAIANTAAGGTVDFAPGLTGTITLTGGVLSITQSVNIVGPGAGSITVSGNHNTTVFDIAPSVANQDVAISGLTIANGAATTNGGGILTNDTLNSLTLSGDAITGNQVTLTSTSGGGGAGVYVGGGTLNVSNSTITNNTVSITGPSSSDNGGGGVYSNGGDIAISASDVSNNVVTQDAGSGDSGGGGIYSSGGGVSIGASTIDGNSFTLVGGTGGDYGGGGVYSGGGAVTVATSTIDGNSMTVQNDTGGDDGGGGVVSQGGNVGVAFSSISNNISHITDSGGDDGGGAVLDEGGDSVYLTSTLSDNSMTISGGGTGNGGGAILSFGTSLISNLTIAGNDINQPGGGILNDGAFQFKNTIVADNTATPVGNCAGAGTFASMGFNLESTNTCHLNATGDLVNTEPGLGPLQNNGGSTPTQALSVGSPAVDAGACTDIVGNSLTIDQRGVARPQPGGGKCDIGAYELVPSFSPPPSAPAAVPGTPAAISSTGASFSASVNPNGEATTVVFQYGLDSRYRPGGGSAVIYDQSTPPQTLPADSAAHAVTASAAGLVPNALYHVRLVASNATGTTVGPDQTFTTPPGPAPPPPVLGKSVNAKPVSGQVFILVGTKLVPLTEAQRIPSGAILDTRAGSLQLTAATTKGHARQTGVFGGAIFKLTQARNGLTNLALAEGAFQGAPGYARCKAHKAGEASAASTKTLQLLHASAKGKFRTTGRYSAATVRGTKWTIADRCDGTLTNDISHSVLVNDFVRHKSIVLHAGQSYLAKAPGHK